jgi:hypothetical protein
VSTIGTPIDITTQELWVGAFLPGSDTDAAWRRLRGTAST